MVANDAITVDMNKYQELLQCLKKNKENVPSELLLTKYEKPYNKLRNDIADMTSQILKDIVLYGWRVEREEAIDVYSVINKVIVVLASGEEAHIIHAQEHLSSVLGLQTEVTVDGGEENG